jgi:hypothetical protein
MKEGSTDMDAYRRMAMADAEERDTAEVLNALIDG